PTSGSRELSIAMKTLRLALRMLLRDWRAGELTVLIAALVLAVGSVGTVSFFADRVKTALGRQANLLLGADLMISGYRPLPSTCAAEGAKRGLLATPGIKSNSMVQKAGGARDNGPAVLTDVKAVASGYPPRSGVTLADPARVEGVRANTIPPRGQAWPDVRL